MDIFIVYHWRTIKCRNVSSTDTIAALNDRLRDTEMCPRENRCFVFGGVVLEDDKTLAFYNIQHDSRLIVKYIERSTHA